MRRLAMVCVCMLAVFSWSGAALGQNSIDVEPSPPQAGSWTLDGPFGFHVDGTFPQIFNDLDVGEYTITWHATEQYFPACGTGPQTQYLGPTDHLVLPCNFVENPSVIINPTGANPHWVLQNTSTWESWSGTGYHNYFYVTFGDYTLTWDSFGGTYPDCGNPVYQSLTSGGQIWDVECTFEATGSVTVNIDPDLPAAAWTLHNNDHELDYNGSGDQVLTGMPPGDYVLTFDDVVCWETPQEVQGTLAAGGTLTLTGTYVQDGTIIVDVNPNGIGATWTLSLGSTHYNGTDGATIGCIEPGDYYMEWDPLADYIRPIAEWNTLHAGETLTITGDYTPAGTIVIDPRPGDTPFRWELRDSSSTIWITSGYQSCFLATGDYTLIWYHEDGWREPSPNPVACTLEQGATLQLIGTYVPAPGIASITDVDNDQGRQVRLLWGRCVHDAPGDSLPVTGYAVYRRQDAYKSLQVQEKKREPGAKLTGWDYLLTVPARGDLQYQCLAPTLCDSTDAGICWSVFMVSALTADPYTFFDSAPDSGYSVDNLAPCVPQGLAVAYQQEGNDLSWQENPEPDVVMYRIYRATMSGGVCTTPQAAPTAEVAGPSWHDPLTGQWHVCYYVSAVDDAGNESPLTDWSGTGVSGVTALPKALSLHANVPNPFNPATTIFYDLPSCTTVELAIYDLSGHRVRTLVDETQDAGSHHVVWQGHDDQGNTVASGVYCYRLRTRSGTLTRRMTLLK